MNEMTNNAEAMRAWDAFVADPRNPASTTPTAMERVAFLAGHAAALASQPQAAVDGGDAVPVVQQTAPKRIWLAVSDDAHDEQQPFPDSINGEVTWSDDTPVEVCVPYVRADLAATPAPAVDREAVREGWESICEDAHEAASYHGNDPRVARRMKRVAAWLDAHPPAEREWSSQTSPPTPHGEAVLKAAHAIRLAQGAALAIGASEEMQAAFLQRCADVISKYGDTLLTLIEGCEVRSPYAPPAEARELEPRGAR